ncbi:putative flavin-containing monooxygenase 1 [Apostasia shenzhenica]|uniref:Flavin-containing monooxygenase n=1 Tax=Apostasia shenzhenica TaxID=1088818 RepID=A0A2H9ZSE2_9ASPA|nr:putative flavin-containing monooxygenase 1 [Apostasia shenzhenica]
MEKRICVVGAGISGLAACKHLLDRGFRPTVFEAADSAGGVWVHTPASTRLQMARWDYQFSDFPWPETVTEVMPDNRQVLDYIQSYARRFDLLRHVRFGEKVAAVELVGVGEEEMETRDLWAGTGDAFGGRGGVWHVTVQHDDGTQKVHVMDFVILCIGRFSGLPNIPTFSLGKGPEVFKGKVIHSMDYSNMGSTAAAELIKGKKVIIIGFLKSALDIAAECANLNGPKNPCTMIVRTKRWNINSLVIWGVPFQYLFFNRFSQLLFHKPGEGLLLSLLSTFLSPLAWIISKFVESYLKRTVPMKKYGMLPEHSFFQAMLSGLLSLLPDNFYGEVEKGSIVLKPSKAFEFCSRGVVVAGETEPVDADLVIFATGFRGDQKLRNMFVSPLLQGMVAGSDETTVPLYRIYVALSRECIHPRIPQMAIIGFSLSVMNMVTSEMSARWLACFLDGGFQLPSVGCMEKNVEEWEKHKKRYSGKAYRRSCINAFYIWYHDLLCRDMGCSPKRKKGFFADLFIPYGPADYAQLELKKK